MSHEALLSSNRTKSPPSSSSTISSSSSSNSSPALISSYSDVEVIDLESGWQTIHKFGLVKLQNIIQNGGLLESQSTSIKSPNVNAALSFTNEEYAKLYTIIYRMCIQKTPKCWTKELYERYDQAICDYLNLVVHPALSRGGLVGSYLIGELVRRWNDHQVMRKWMHDFFRYIDRFFVKRHGKKSLSDVAIARFRSLIFDKYKTKITHALLELIKRDRSGEEVDRGLLRQAIQIYVEMGLGSIKIYQHDFEKSFLSASREYYLRESTAWVASDSCTEYLKKCEVRFQDERNRVRDYLIAGTQTHLIHVLNDTLLLHHQRALLEKENTGVRALLKSNAEGDLSRLFHLYSAIPSSLPYIASMLHGHIVDLGLGLLEKTSQLDSAVKNTYIEDLMRIHTTYFELVRNCFQGHAAFQKALKEAFETIINKQSENSSTAELLASYADDVLRKGGLQLDESQVEKSLDSIVRLFSYLSDKDLFAEYYKKQLATRLLTQRSASNESEKAMIGKLKLLMGAQFTSKFEGMFNDMRNAQDHLNDFQQFIASRQINMNGIEFTVQTLTTGFWPSYPLDEVKLSPIMKNCLDTFQVYYDTKTTNRKLRWIHDLGTVTLSGNFQKRHIDLVCTTLQSVVLLLFNERDQWPIEELINSTGMNAELMKQTLKSLVSGKFKILIKHPVESYHPSHTMTVNYAFQSPAIKIRLPNPIRKTTQKDRESANASVSEDRRHAMEANIVRVLKTRKLITHQELMIEVSKQLMNYFEPDPRAIKQRIEDLIQREYMKRDEEQSNLYHYVA